MLFIPDLVEQACIELLGERHEEHLAALERQLALTPETIERLVTRDLLPDNGQEKRLEMHLLPAVLLGIFELDDEPMRHSDGPKDVLSMPWRLELDVFVQGRDYRDAKLRTWWTAFTVAECLLQRLARRSEPVESLELKLPFTVEALGEPSNALGHAELTFAVVMPAAITVRGGLPIDAPPTPADGEPGGAPATPYAEPVPWPIATEVDVDVDINDPTED